MHRYIILLLAALCVSCGAREYHEYEEPYEVERVYIYEYEEKEVEWCYWDPMPYQYLEPVACYDSNSEYFESCCTYIIYNEWCEDAAEEEEWCYSAYSCEWELSNHMCAF